MGVVDDDVVPEEVMLEEAGFDVPLEEAVLGFDVDEEAVAVAGKVAVAKVGPESRTAAPAVNSLVASSQQE